MRVLSKQFNIRHKISHSEWTAALIRGIQHWSKLSDQATNLFSLIHYLLDKTKYFIQITINVNNQKIE